MQSIRISLVQGGIMPTKAHASDAGYDLYARLPVPTIIEPNRAALVPVGFVINLPEGFEAQIRSRSGLALKESLFVLNSPGTIDSGYLGEVGVILHNLSDHNAILRDGARVAQMVIHKLPDVDLILSDGVFAPTERGSGGFGSTG